MTGIRCTAMPCGRKSMAGDVQILALILCTLCKVLGGCLSDSNTPSADDVQILALNIFHLITAAGGDDD